MDNTTIHSRSNKSDYKWTNEAAENIYKNAEKLEQRRSESSKRIRDTIITATECSTGIGGAAKSIYKSVTGTTNSDESISMTRQAALDVDISTKQAERINKAINKAVSATKDFLFKPMDPSKYKDIYKYKNRHINDRETRSDQREAQRSFQSINVEKERKRSRSGRKNKDERI